MSGRTRMHVLEHKRLLAGAAVVLAIAAAAFWPDAVEVDVAAVTRGPMQVTIDEEGETRVRDRFVISAPVAGRLERIVLEPGDPVRQGTTTLARITPVSPPLIDPRTRAELAAAVEASRAAVQQARAERERAAAVLARAKSALERQRALAAAGAVARDDLEDSETALRTAEEASRAAEFAVRRGEYELQLARARLQAPAQGGRQVEIVAPADGVVLRRLRESESVVAPGEPLLEIGDPSRIEIVADLLSTDAVRVKPGQDVAIEQWGGGHALQGDVRRIEPSGFTKISALGVEEQRVNVVVDFVDPIAAARVLGDGYRVEVRIVVWDGDDVLKVPVGSLFRRGAEWAVFVVNDGRAHVQPVTVGQRSETEGQILGGLSAGQRVVLHPPDTLTDDARVAVRGG